MVVIVSGHKNGYYLFMKKISKNIYGYEVAQNDNVSFFFKEKIKSGGSEWYICDVHENCDKKYFSSFSRALRHLGADNKDLQNIGELYLKLLKSFPDYKKVSKKKKSNNRKNVKNLNIPRRNPPKRKSPKVSPKLSKKEKEVFDLYSKYKDFKSVPNPTASQKSICRKILGVTRLSTRKSITKKYRKLILKFHPDKCKLNMKDPRALNACNQLGTIINGAKDCLS